MADKSDADKLIDFGLGYIVMWFILIMTNVVFLILMTTLGIPVLEVEFWTILMSTGFVTGLIQFVERRGKTTKK